MNQIAKMKIFDIIDLDRFEFDEDNNYDNNIFC